LKDTTPIYFHSATYAHEHGELEFIYGYECETRIADAEFLLSKRQYANLTGRSRGADDVIAYHLRQAFKPGDGIVVPGKFVYGKFLAFIRAPVYNREKIRKDNEYMEYMSCPEAAKNGEFPKDVFKNYVKKIAYQASLKSDICG